MFRQYNNVRIIGPVIFDAFYFFTKETYYQILAGNDTVVEELLFKHVSGEGYDISRVSEQVQKRS